MASDPIEIARDAYLAYVQERGHIPKRTVHLFNWGKYSGFKGIKFISVRRVLSNPPDVGKILKERKSATAAAAALEASGEDKASMEKSKKSLAELYQMYQEEHDGKIPSTVARFQHFCELSGHSKSYAECSLYWMLHRHSNKNNKNNKKKSSKQQQQGEQRGPEDSDNSSRSSSSSSSSNKEEAVVVSLTDMRYAAAIAAVEEESKGDDDELKMPSVASYTMDEEHVKKEVKEHTSDMKLSDEDIGGGCMKLQEIFDKIEVSDEQLSMWAGYGGGRLFQNKAAAASRLKTVLSHADNKGSVCSEHIRHKMRVITKLILEKGIEKSDEYVHILLLLASHGNVCNVMKEVAIGNAYGILTDKMDDFVQQQTLEQQLLKVLRDFRVLQVEAVFHDFKMTNNTHYIAGFHNELAPKIGLVNYNDEHICTPSTSKVKDWKKNLDRRYFAEYYTMEKVVNHVLEQISEKKIGYQKVVQFLEDVCPKDVKKMHFLQSAIDIDTGKINPEYIAFMLEKFGVLKQKSEDWKPIEVCWDEIKK